MRSPSPPRARRAAHVGWPLAAALALGACDVFLPKLHGSGAIVREERPAAAVHRVAVAGGDLDVVLRVAERPSLVLEGDDNLLAHVRTETLGDRLTIRWADGRYAPTRDVRVELAVPGLEHLALTGAVRCAASGLDADRLDVSLAGACDLELAGRADALDADLAGACRLGAFDLAARTAKVDLAGACHANVHALETLAADAAGASDVRYRGEPAVTRSTGGVSSVRPE